MKPLITLLFIGLFSIYGISQGGTDTNNPLDNISDEEFRIKMASTITPEDLEKHLSILASDEFEGRETGAPGNDRAAQYLAGEFKRLGLQTVDKDDDYLQPINMVSKRWEKIDMTIHDKKYRHIWDFYALHDGNNGPDEFHVDEVIFLGYGIESDQFTNYKKTDIDGKAVIMYGGEPRHADGRSIITGSESMSAWTTDPMKKIQLAKSKGARVVFVISEDFKKQIADNRRFLMGPSVTLEPPKNDTDVSADFSFMVINPEMAKKMIGKKVKKVKKFRGKNTRGKSTKGFSISTSVQGHMIRRELSKLTANVIGVLPGSHPQKKDEHIVITAHFDHLGKRGSDIFNGADDNASGTSTVVELAEAFSTAAAFDRRPDRSIIFLLVSGEEKGLLGSKFYTDYPLIPLNQTTTNVNIDMVGRVDKLHDDPNYIYVIGSDRLSTTLHEVNETINDNYEKLVLDYKYNAVDDPNRYYYRSDHYNFAEKNIPAIFFFNGTHDDYHRPSDTIEKIEFEKMSKIGRHIFHLVWELANRDEVIEVDVHN